MLRCLWVNILDYLFLISVDKYNTTLQLLSIRSESWVICGNVLWGLILCKGYLLPDFYILIENKIKRIILLNLFNNSIKNLKYSPI